jgi:hypothetical protein
MKLVVMVQLVVVEAYRVGLERFLRWLTHRLL